jgi:O-antigen biosynthesis protein
MTMMNSQQITLRKNRALATLKEQGIKFTIGSIIQRFKKLVKKAVSPKLVNSLYPLLPEIPFSEDSNYYSWLVQHYPRKADLQTMKSTLDALQKPLISILMPVYNTPELFLKAAIESVLAQVYPCWELCIADDNSTQPHIQKILEDYQAQDPRIKVLFRAENGNISACSNSALEIATGDFIALLDHDDLLTPDALYQVALLLNCRPNVDMIYSDEDKIDVQGKLTQVYFKPDWCPDSFLSRMYTCHLGVYRKSIANRIGGFRKGFEGAQDYDFVLRFTEQTDKVFHLPHVLYHWRIHGDSTADRIENKEYAVDSSLKAIAEAIERRAEPGSVTRVEPGGYTIVRYQIQNPKQVSVIIPTRNLGKILDRCLYSIFKKTTYPNYEIIIIDNGSTEKETLETIKKWRIREPHRFKCYPLDIPFNFPKINNYAVSKAKGEYLLFLNNDTEILTPDWMSAMVEQSQRPAIGAVGALLLYPDNTVQHAGVVMGIGGVAGHSHKHYPADAYGYFSQIQTVNNYLALTAACLMCRREIFEEVEGFEENLCIAFNDIDFCLKIVDKGYRNIYLPHVRLYHYESKSRGYENTPEKVARFNKEINFMQKKWPHYISYDPCYSPHLSRKGDDYSIEI